MRRRHRDAQPRGAGRHRRRAHRLDEQAALEQRRLERDGPVLGAGGIGSTGMSNRPDGSSGASAVRSRAVARRRRSTRSGSSVSTRSAARAAATVGWGRAVEKISARPRWSSSWRTAGSPQTAAPWAPSPLERVTVRTTWG